MRKSLGVEISIAGDLPARVSGDAVRLRSALENLIDNAVKFTERGQVSLSVTAEPAARRRLRLTFTVADTGIGIVAADLKRLFRPFAQANESVAQRFGGSGLGLSFARRIAEAMGGSLTVKSSPGQGSTFRLVVVVDPARPEKKAANASADAFTGLHVLCVEDNPYGRVVLNTVLGELGHQVSFAETGESAVAAVGGGGYDVVLMDVALPGIDGFETTRRIRALPGPSSAIPIIGVSGRSRRGRRGGGIRSRNEQLPAQAGKSGGSQRGAGCGRGPEAEIVNGGRFAPDGRSMQRDVVAVSRLRVRRRRRPTSPPSRTAWFAPIGNDVARKIFSNAYTPVRQQAVLRSQKTIPGFDCPADPQIALAEVIPYPVKQGTTSWIERYVVGCTPRTMRNFLLVLEGEQPRVIDLLPGNTNTDPLLQRDALQGRLHGGRRHCARRIATRRLVTDTRLTSKIERGAPWTERWIFDLCGTKAEVEMTFTPSDQQRDDAGAPR